MSLTVGQVINELMSLAYNTRIYVMYRFTMYYVLSFDNHTLSLDITIRRMPVGLEVNTKLIKDLENLIVPENNTKELLVRFYDNGTLNIFSVSNLNTDRYTTEGILILNIIPHS
jgi:hypothetical protein